MRCLLRSSRISECRRSSNQRLMVLPHFSTVLSESIPLEFKEPNLSKQHTFQHVDAHANVHVDKRNQGLMNVMQEQPGTLYGLDHRSKQEHTHQDFSKLERFVQQEGIKSNHELNTCRLNQVIHQWAESLDSNITASDVLRQLESYRIMAPELYPDSNTYYMIMNAAIMRDEHDAHKLAEEIIDVLLRNEDCNPFIQPNTHLFNTAIQAWAKCSDSDAPLRVDALLETMKRLTKEGVHGVAPNQKTYNAVLQVWCLKGVRPGSAIRAESLLLEMPHPNTINFYKVIKLWRCSRAPGFCDRMLSVFARFKELYKSGDEMTKPNGYLYGELLIGLSYEGRAREAETILQELINLYENSDEPSLAPKREYFTSLIDAWSKSGEPDAPERAENILQLMQNMARQYKNDDMQPDTTTFNCIIHAYARCDRQEAYRRASFILQRMWDLYDGGMTNVKPNHSSYTFVLETLVNSKQSDAAPKAASLLESMHARRLTGDKDLIPTLSIYNAVLESWTKSCLPNACEEAELVIDEMKRMSERWKFPTAPTLYSYNLLCRVWERSGRREGIAQCQKIFSNLKSLEKLGFTNFAPNDMTFHTLLQAYNRNPGMAQTLLDTMCHDYINGTSKVKPTVESFNSVIKACLQRYDLHSIKEAEGIYYKLKEMHEVLDVKPDARTFNILMSAWSVTKDCDYIIILQKIKEYENEMMTLFDAGDSACQPTAITYNAIFRVLSYGAIPDALEQCLSILDDLKANDKLPNLPHESNYHLVLRVLRDRQDCDKAQKSWDLLQDMILQGLTPIDEHFNAVINVCARAGVFDQETHEKAFDIAMATFRLLLRSSSPTPATFIHLFHTAAGLDKHDEIDEVYKLCCKYKFDTNDSVRQAMQKAGSPHLLSRARKEVPKSYNFVRT